MAEGYLANRKMVHCLVPVLFKLMIVNPNNCALLGTPANGNNDNKSTGAGMDILALLLAAVIVTFIMQLLTSVIMIATMVLTIII